MAIAGLSEIKSLARKNTLLIDQQKVAKFNMQEIDGRLCLLYGDGRRFFVPPIKFRPYQQVAHDKLFKEGIRHLFCVRPRRAGKETESWNVVIEAAIRRPGNYIMMYPSNVRGRRILWDGNINYQGKMLPFRKMIPAPAVKGKPKQDEMKITLANDANIYVMGADADPDAVRGMNPFGIVYSEFAYSDPRVRSNLMPVIRENGGWEWIQTTFDGMNHAYRLMQMVKDNPEWFCTVDSALTLVDASGNRYVTDAMIQADRDSGMSEFEIQQEYFSVVTPNESNIYFAREIKYIDDNNRVLPDLLLRSPVYMAWDIGMSDATSIIFFQIDQKGDPNIVYYIENSNKGLEYYANEIFQFRNQTRLVLGDNFFPHDGEKREFTNAAGKTIADSARDLGLSVIVIERPHSKLAAIQKMRNMLMRTWFDKKNCARIIECLSSYSKVFDTKNNIYRDKPLHNWTSHCVDSYQTMTLAIEGGYVVTGVKHGVVYMGDNTSPKAISFMGGR